MLAVLTSAHTVWFGPPLFVIVDVDVMINGSLQSADPPHAPQRRGALLHLLSGGLFPSGRKQILFHRNCDGSSHPMWRALPHRNSSG